jgi:hypothetical protein
MLIFTFGFFSFCRDNFVILLHHSQENQKFLSNFIKFFSLNFLFFANRTRIRFKKELLFKSINFLLVNYMIFICPETVHKFLQKLFNEYTLSVLFILTPILGWRSVVYFFLRGKIWRQFALIHYMCVFTSESIFA